MSETLQYIVAKSLEIAWDYLEATGELGNPDRAAEHLLDTIEAMIRHGERRPLLLSNKAIASLSAVQSGAGTVHCVLEEQPTCPKRRTLIMKPKAALITSEGLISSFKGLSRK